MRRSQCNTSLQLEALQQQVSRWPLALRHLHQQIAACFARPEPRQHALLYLKAILNHLPRKNGWQIAEHAAQASPSGMQRLLSQAVWDQDGVRDQLRTALVQSLQPPAQSCPSTPFAVLVLDESGFPKRGTHSAGVAPQDCGATGRVENCQVGIFLSYVTERGHGLIDRELYLPEDWCADPARRQEVRIPDTVRFRTKPELGQLMIERCQQAQILISWVVADTSTATVLTCAPSWNSRTSPTPWRFLLSRWSPCRAKMAPSSPILAARRSWSSHRTGNGFHQAWEAKASISSTGPDCPCCIREASMDVTGSSFVAASMTPASSAFLWSLRPPGRLCRSWCRPVAHAGASRRTCKPAKTWAWITMKCAPTWAAIVT